MVRSDAVSIWNNRSRIRFRCAGSGRIETGLPEVSYEQPEICAALDPAAIRRRVLTTSDFTILDGSRYFVRVTLLVPIIGYDERFHWAAWVEVGWPAFKAYFEAFEDEDNSNLPAFPGRLANRFDGFPRSMGLAGIAYPRAHGERPHFVLKSRTHPLARAQFDGVTPQQAVAQAQSVGVLLMLA
jgi:hypothetical protein